MLKLYNIDFLIINKTDHNLFLFLAIKLKINRLLLFEMILFMSFYIIMLKILISDKFCLFFLQIFRILKHTSLNIIL